jgi:hypothetical protein
MKIRKVFAIGWLALAVPLGAVKAFQLYFMSVGIYDPVLHDQMPAEEVAGFRSWLIGVIAITFGSSVIAAWYVRHTSTSKRA